VIKSVIEFSVTWMTDRWLLPPQFQSPIRWS